mmetsp:Transcript_6018/g.20550  ORF Transcript_6018/g.20550 Transcript_6018/m.20550 type:complete len:244 (-) Transcript_6018:368-1099(-)
MPRGLLLQRRFCRAANVQGGPDLPARLRRARAIGVGPRLVRAHLARRLRRLQAPDPLPGGCHAPRGPGARGLSRRRRGRGTQARGEADRGRVVRGGARQLAQGQRRNLQDRVRGHPPRAPRRHDDHARAVGVLPPGHVDGDHGRVGRGQDDDHEPGHGQGQEDVGRHPGQRRGVRVARQVAEPRRLRAPGGRHAPGAHGPRELGVQRVHAAARDLGAVAQAGARVQGPRLAQPRADPALEDRR